MFLTLLLVVGYGDLAEAGRGGGNAGGGISGSSMTDRDLDDGQRQWSNDRSDDMRYLEQREYDRRYRDQDPNVNESRRELRKNEENYLNRDLDRDRIGDRDRDRDRIGDRDDLRERPYDRERDANQDRYNDRDRYDNRDRDDELSPAAREREWRRKIEQEQKELGQGSEQGQTQREEHRRKWWKFWN
jgi:hypothetical protein